jgi:hypothetical protein
MKGDATMVQLILLVLIVWMIAGLVGIIWMVVRHSFNDNDYSDNNQLGGSPSSEPCGGKDPHESSSRQSKAMA